MSEAVQARFYVAEVTKTNGGETGRVVLQAVSRGDQNKEWASATPGGRIELTVNNMPAFEKFVGWQGTNQDVSVLLTPVPVRRPDDGHEFRQAVDFEGNTGGSYYSQVGICGDCGHQHN